MTFDELRATLKEQHLVLDDAMMEKLDHYLHLLVEWNEKFNLTSIVIPEEIIEKHFYDCLIASDPTLFQHQQRCWIPWYCLGDCLPRFFFHVIRRHQKEMPLLRRSEESFGLV